MSTGNIEDIVGAGGEGINSAVDPTTGALPVQRVDDPRFDDLTNPVLINVTGLSVATTYYPDVNGASQLGYKSLAFGGTLTGTADPNSITFTVETRINGIWIDVTGLFTTAAGASPPGTIQAPNATPVPFAISAEHFSYEKWRAVLVISGGTASAATVGSHQKAI
jgi:hypothetical protein